VPVIRVHGLPQKDPARVPAALEKACAAVAEAYGCKLKQVWATWQDIAPGHYIEGADAARSQPGETHPPIAEILAFEGRAPETIEKTVEAAAAALSEGLGLDANIFVYYRELKSGQVAAGDGVLRRKAS
jgi:hypothetical protein